MVREVVTLLVLSKGQIHHFRGLDPIKVLSEALGKQSAVLVKISEVVTAQNSRITELEKQLGERGLTHQVKTRMIRMNDHQ